MYGSFVLIERSGKSRKAERILLGAELGRNEAWLRNKLFENSDVIPIDEIDPAFGRVAPLCKELRTEVGSIDAAFVNEAGLITIVECKLWKNPQARREVVGQALDYLSAISKWSYQDLQRQVSAALGVSGDLPYEIVHQHLNSNIRRQDFVEAVNQSLRAGRILLLIVGEGITANVQSIVEFISKFPNLEFKFGLVEFAVYMLENEHILMQPRVLAQTEIISRQVVVVNTEKETLIHTEKDIEHEEAPVSGSKRDRWKPWWQPVLDMKFDDIEQEAPFWVGTNNVVLNTPFPGIKIKAYAVANKSPIGVFVAGARQDNVNNIQEYIKRDRKKLIEQLPHGTLVSTTTNSWPILIETTDFQLDDERRDWIAKRLNEFVNVLRPWLKKCYTEHQC